MAHDGFNDRARPSKRRRRKRGQHFQALGRSKGGFTTKIHAVCDALGKPMRFLLTGGERNDCTQAFNLLQGFSVDILIADKAYDADDILDACAQAVIPPRITRKIQRNYDTYLYKKRNLIERLFNKLKHFRRVSTRYDKLASSFLSFVHIASIYLWLQ